MNLVNENRKRKALLYSASICPGVGEYYLGYKGRGVLFIAASIAILFRFLYVMLVSFFVASKTVEKKSVLYFIKNIYGFVLEHEGIHLLWLLLGLFVLWLISIVQIKWMIKS